MEIDYAARLLFVLLDGSVVCVDAMNGDFLWVWNCGGPLSSPSTVTSGSVTHLPQFIPSYSNGTIHLFLKQENSLILSDFWQSQDTIVTPDLTVMNSVQPKYAEISVSDGEILCSDFEGHHSSHFSSSANSVIAVVRTDRTVQGRTKSGTWKFNFANVLISPVVMGAKRSTLKEAHFLEKQISIGSLFVAAHVNGHTIVKDNADNVLWEEHFPCEMLRAYVVPHFGIEDELVEIPVQFESECYFNASANFLFFQSRVPSKLDVSDATSELALISSPVISEEFLQLKDGNHQAIQTLCGCAKSDTTSFFQDNFVPLKFLGAGAYGHVILVQHRPTGMYYAMKIMCATHPGEEEEIIREVRVHGPLLHENVVRYHFCWSEKRSDFVDQILTEFSNEATEGESGKVSSLCAPQNVVVANFNSKIFFFQMEFCPMTLAQWMAKRAVFCLKDVLEIASQIMSALIYLHNKEIVHRDIKPANIFVSERVNGQVSDICSVKLGDFGVAKAAADQTHAPHNFFDLEEDTVGVGSPAYASPEQLAGKLCGSQSDVFSTGIVLGELLSICTTACERDHILRDLRKRDFSRVAVLSSSAPELSDQTKQTLSSLLAAMLDNDAALRPTPHELKRALRGLQVLNHLH